MAQLETAPRAATPPNIAWHEEVDVTAYVNDYGRGDMFWNIEN